MKSANKTILITSILIVAFHFLLSFIGRTVVATPLLTIGFYGLLYCLLVSLLKRIFKTKSSRALFISQIVVTLIAVLGLLQDFSIRYGNQGHTYASYSEKNGNFFYNSGYRFHNLWKGKYDYKAGEPGSKKLDKKTEFEYEYSYNNLGFRNDGADILPKAINEYRILALGDSWTEGVGTPDGQTWTALLNNRLNQYNSAVKVINIGKAGSDPVYSFHMFNQVVDELLPNEIILTLNTSDVNDIVSRGGKERFKKNGKVALRKGPWWEFLYAGSYSIRRYLRSKKGFNKVLIPQEQMVNEYKKAYDEIHNSIIDFHTFCTERNIQMTVVFVPEFGNMNRLRKRQTGVTWGILTRLHQEISAYKIRSIYLPECYFSRIQTDLRSYWWVKDYHHTPKGYAIMAECLGDKLLP